MKERLHVPQKYAHFPGYYRNCHSGDLFPDGLPAFLRIVSLVSERISHRQIPCKPCIYQPRQPEHPDDCYRSRYYPHNSGILSKRYTIALRKSGPFGPFFGFLRGYARGIVLSFLNLLPGRQERSTRTPGMCHQGGFCRCGVQPWNRPG
jgi:hypothetical protein